MQIDILKPNCEEVPCFWLRGIVPQSCTFANSDDIPVRRTIKYQGDRPTGKWPSGTYYGDGSGGVYTSYPTLSRCGVGIALVENGVLILGAKYRLPRPHQTVPRVELSAIATLLEYLDEGAHVTYIGDNKPVVDRYLEGEAACLRSTNGDLYSLVFKYIREKNISFSIKWMPSHLMKNLRKSAQNG